jgi:hypothetical protein
MLSFEELTEARRSLQSFCLLHVPSLLSLQSGISFKLKPEDTNLSSDVVRHMTTSATCWTSLFDCPPRFVTAEFKEKFDAAKDLGPTFGQKALLRPDPEWKSEKSAVIYCRCRALPMIISSSNETALDERIQRHLEVILVQLKKQAERFGIGEANPDKKEDEWYPPNAFHTYWTMEILDKIERKFPDDYSRLSLPDELDIHQRREGMLLWARQKLGYQLGLHSATPQSSLLDTDQLAWSLAVFLRFDKTLTVNLENRDFVKQAFKCLFSTQIEGTWRHYKPLFHYEAVGNAYCYVFETFAVLLQSALQEGAKARMVRELLEPYCKNLMDLWRYANLTKIPLSLPGKGVGWCSGHRTNFTAPESWATASVFSYAQALRRLVGIWCREEALRSLNTPQSQFSSEQAAEEMISRGKTWDMNKTPVSELLQTMFINPVRMYKRDDKLEPDSQPIEKWQARSAILFGPPGTSKTFLIRVLPDIIGWKYVEIHASHFVAEGLTQVQKTADRIFKQLLELDHAVVLFDEIDELVRERDMEKDAFGRFLTTSMLPKLAELWEARKILYFVATNHINYFDSAIIRSQRFDALTLVSPPSYQSKIQGLTKLLSDVHGIPSIGFQTEEKQIQKELRQMEMDQEKVRKPKGKSAENESEETLVARWREQALASDRALAKFALLRYDELNELANRLALDLKALPSMPEVVSTEILRKALVEIADSEWRKNKSYTDYIRDSRSERRDYRMLNVWEVTGNNGILSPKVLEANNTKWLAEAVDSPQDIKIPGLDVRPVAHGRVQVLPSVAK